MNCSYINNYNNKMGNWQNYFIKLFFNSINELKKCLKNVEELEWDDCFGADIYNEDYKNLTFTVDTQRKSLDEHELIYQISKFNIRYVQLIAYSDDDGEMLYRKDLHKYKNKEDEEKDNVEEYKISKKLKFRNVANFHLPINMEFNLIKKKEKNKNWNKGKNHYKDVEIYKKLEKKYVEMLKKIPNYYYEDDYY